MSYLILMEGLPYAALSAFESAWSYARLLTHNYIDILDVDVSGARSRFRGTNIEIMNLDKKVQYPFIN